MKKTMAMMPRELHIWVAEFRNTVAMVKRMRKFTAEERMGVATEYAEAVCELERLAAERAE